MKTLYAVFVLFVATLARGQSPTQTVRGTVTDADNKLPVPGVAVVVPGSEPITGTVTNEKGEFRLEEVPVGRLQLQFSFTGYATVVLSNLEINSGKEVVLAVSMEESVSETEEVVVTGEKNKGEALNEMSVVSSRSISSDESKRFANSYNDPGRILANFAGVATQDGSNDIIVRGNSPKYMQWRLDGVEITNPNHFADQNAISGGISALNNNLLSTSDFSTGAFAPEYGDVLSGVYDVNLRTGNNQKRETALGAGIMGTDLTAEGPFKKEYGGSYLVNYRYSTISLINALGLLDVDGTPTFQDGAFKIVLPSKKAGTLSFFGLGGHSKVEFKDIKPNITPTPGQRSMLPGLTEDYRKMAFLANAGLNHVLTLNEKGFLKTSLAYSVNGITDDIFEYGTYKITGPSGEYLRDSVTSRTENFKSKLSRSAYRTALTYHHKFSSGSKIQIGSKFALFGYEYRQSQRMENASPLTTMADFNEQIPTLRNFISWKYRLTDRISFVTGVHHMYVIFNNKHSLEPRFALNWKINHTNSVHFGYGKHSAMESVHNYFAKVKQPDGTVTEPNRNLDLLKAHHFVIGYEKRFTAQLMLKLEAYYQDLYNLPVENSDTSHYATLNEGLLFRYVELVNKGTGKNYGLEMTLERFFYRNYYFLLNASLYNSTYQTLERTERNTQYNGNYLVNLLAGKDFRNLGRKRNQVLNLNIKTFFGGGKKIIPLLRDGEGKLAVDPANGRFYDYKKAYNNKLEDTYQVTLSASYKWNKPKTTHELFINLENLTNARGRLSEYYDETQPGNIGYVKQFGLFPNLMYRMYF